MALAPVNALQIPARANRSGYVFGYTPGIECSSNESHCHGVAGVGKLRTRPAPHVVGVWGIGAPPAGGRGRPRARLGIELLYSCAAAASGEIALELLVADHDAHLRRRVQARVEIGESPAVPTSFGVDFLEGLGRGLVLEHHPLSHAATMSTLNNLPAAFGGAHRAGRQCGATPR